jgi:limonene-1,2-epoxide hydrolase
MSSSEDVVRRFCAVVSTRDAAVVRPLLHDDIVYLNVGMPVTVGIEDVMANLEGQWQMFSGVYEFDIRNVASSGGTVLTERVDTVGAAGGRAASLPLMGVFEVVDGTIKAWRDYFDSALIAKLMSGEDVAGLVPA